MKFISWNVNGLRACIKPKTDDDGNVVSKGFEAYFKELDADFFCLQETKMQQGQLDLEFEGYQSYWNYADKKGYSGTAIFTRHQPLAVTYGLGIDEHDHEGRVITLEYPDFYLITCYTPNSQEALPGEVKPKRLGYRMQWEDDFRAYMMRLNETKPVIVCGDLNVAHEEIDLKNPKTNRNNAGFTDEEREKMTTLLGSGFIDTFRTLYPEQVTYSWWSYRFKAREKNTGWRIDYFITSETLKDRIADAKIHTEIFGSDHCPVELLLK
jgi:exodeoxyribonuclease III